MKRGASGAMATGKALHGYPSESSIPINTEEDHILGIDEAGRGPVLGPMVYGICWFPVKDYKEKFTKMGFADSKQLTEDRREVLFAKMIELGIGYNTAVLDPEMLSGSMLRLNKYNLNDISHDTAVGLVRELIKKGLKVKEVYVDTVGPPEKYQRKLEGLFSGAKITVSKKADSLFPIVSAASIAAKVIRDHRLKTWTFKERNLTAVSTNFGSGYPADPMTKAWLKQNMEAVFGYPTVIRFSWKTTDNLLKGAVPVEWVIDEEDEEDGGKDAPPLKRARKKSQMARSPFFSSRGIGICETLE